jgi:hypothetical protein
MRFHFMVIALACVAPSALAQSPPPRGAALVPPPPPRAVPLFVPDANVTPLPPLVLTPPAARAALPPIPAPAPVPAAPK